jgi:ribosomal protein L11 methyltransferase
MSSPGNRQAKESSSKWFALDLDVEPPAREAVEYALMEAGALGTETNEADPSMLVVSAYFHAPPHRERVRAELAEAFRIYSLPSTSVRDMKFREVPDSDWLQEWKKSWQPVEVGNFIVAPPWSEITNDHNRHVIRIEPGMAFGTGTHETTRLCLKAITRFFRGKSFIDVGTGTGILAIAAAKASPDSKIWACDTDAEAIAIAKENARANNVADFIEFHAGSLSATQASADFVCANLTADVIALLLPDLIAATCGRLVLSGILDVQADGILDQLSQAASFSNPVVLRDGEWVAIVV